MPRIMPTDPDIRIPGKHAKPHMVCPICKGKISLKLNRCPHCGALMQV